VSPRLVALAALAVAAVLRAPPAAAHAFLDHADPRVGSTVAAPAAVTLTFTEPVEEAFSHVELLDAGGNKVDTAALEHPAPATLRVSVPALAPGEYTVRWAVVSVDTHPTEGKFTFSVKAR
jgi:methionine-rich copper-binding protein CopC